MSLNTVTLPDFTKLATIKFLKAQDSVPQLARNSGIWKMDPIPNHTGDTKEYTEIDLEEYADNKDEGDQAEIAKFQQGFTKTLTLVRRGKDIKITVEMRKRNKYPEVTKRLTNLGKLVPNRMDLDLSHRLTFGTADSFVDKNGKTVDISTGDGLSLFNTAHLLNGSATTFRNRLANNPQLSQGALEGMERLVVEETLNQFGEKMSTPFDILWYTDDPNTKNTARELMQSTAKISAPNEGVTNVYQAKYRTIELPRVATDAGGFPDSSKAKFWGLVSSEDSSAFLAIQEESFLNSPAVGMNAEDVSTEDWTYAARGSYGIVSVGARWIKFSSGDGAL